MKLFSLFVALFPLVACHKDGEQLAPQIKQECASCYLISDKYTIDTVWLKRDTLWHDLNLCGKWLEGIEKEKPYWMLFCNPPHPLTDPLFILEYRFYLIKNN